MTAMIASMLTPNAVRAARSAGSLPRSPEPSRPPISPAATPATAEAMSASGRKPPFHGSCITRCDQPHSAQKPTVPIRAPAAAPSASGRSREMSRAASSTQRAAPT